MLRRERKGWKAKHGQQVGAATVAVKSSGAVAGTYYTAMPGQHTYVQRKAEWPLRRVPRCSQARGMCSCVDPVDQQRRYH